MANLLMEFRLRIRNAANSADALVVSSVPGGTNPYLGEDPPSGSGEAFDPRTGETEFAEYTGDIVDAEIGSMQRLVTSLTEDAGGRPQLGYRASVLEYRIDGGSWLTLINGVLTRLEKTNAATWTYAVGDPLHALKVTQLFAPSSDTLITDFLDQWPARGCVLGGPIIGGGTDAMRITDLRGWTMRVEALANGQYGLQPVVVYGPPRWIADDKMRVVDVQEAINEAASQVQTPLSNGARSAWSTIGDAYQNGWAWRGLVVLINGVPWKPLTVYDDDLGVGSTVGRPLLVTGSNRGRYAMKVIDDDEAPGSPKTLTDGALVRVRVLTVLPSEISPLYVSGHPCELATRFLTAAGLSYNASSFDDLTDLIGRDASMSFRITSARQLSELLSTICRRDGIGLRGNDDGEIEAFDGRLGRLTTDPIVTITDADVVEGSTKPYRLDPSRAIKNIVFRSKYFVDQRSIPVRRNDATIIDGVTVVDQELPVSNSDVNAIPHGDFELSLDAMIHATKTLYPSLRDFWVAIARRLFDRWGRGGVDGETVLIRGGGGGSVRLGDEVFMDVSQMVNHNYMLVDNAAIAARAVQIIRRQWRPTGWAVKYEDAGASRQPPSTLPTLTIAASSDRPRTVAEVTITNAATLNAAGYAARLQVAFTDDGSDANTAQFTDVMAWAPGEIPTDPIRLPPAVAATTVQARGRSELPGARGTNWSALSKVTLDGVDPVSGLTATPDTDGSKCLLEWTPGSATDLADIWLRLDGETFAQAARVATLEPGSAQHELTGLTPGEDYIASVVQRDPGTQDVSAEVDEPFTAAATGATLAAPEDPAAFAGSLATGRVSTALLGSQSLRGGRYGIAVVATEFPGEVEIAEAVETAPGAGTYGSFVTVARIDSVSGNWTLWQSIAPNDNLRRQLKARHVRDGTTASSYTAIVVATPWTYQGLPAYPGDALLELKVTPLTPTAPDRFAYRLTPRDPYPSGAADLDLDLDAESGLINYEYNSTTPAAPIAVASGTDQDYEAIRPLAGDGAKSVSWNVTKGGRRIGLSGPIVIPEMPPDVPGGGSPEFVSVGLSSISAPCDGGGSATLNFTTANMPGGETYNVSWTVLTGTYAGTSGSDTGISSGYVINTALCPGETLRVTLTANSGGVIAIDVEDFTT